MGCTPATSSHTEDIPPSTDTSKCCSEHFHDCQNLNRLRHVLWYYHKWTLSLESNNEEEKKQNIGIYDYIHTLKHFPLDEATKTYSNIYLLKDYHHLISFHQFEFEDIYNYFCDSPEHIKCSIGRCSLMSRNHRARSRSDNDNNGNGRPSRAQLYHASDDYHQVITQQLLDQIHSYIYHSFDIGFKLTRKEEVDLAIDLKDNISISSINDLSPTNAYLLTRDDTADDSTEYDITHNTDIRRCERIGSIMQRKRQEIAELELLEDKNKFMSIREEIVYSFGKRFYYNKAQYKENDALDIEFNIGSKYSDWFIERKYKNIQEELMSNKTARITEEQFKDLYAKSEYYMETDYVLKHCKGINIAQLICVQIYCNFDELQSAFTKTYRHNKNESDQELRERHKEFRNLGKTLRLAVESNGIRVEKGATKVFFHGINVKMNFTSTLHKFYAPTSTSGEYTVALAFTSGEGIVLELNDGTWLWKQQNSMYFDCEFISDFGYEKEKLFMGGAVPLKIVSIFDVKSNTNYAVYIFLINLLLSIVAGDISVELSKRNEMGIINLLKHESNEKRIDGIPQYIDSLLHSVCLNVDTFTTRWTQTFGRKDNKYKKLGNYLCSVNAQFVDLNVLCTLFPNLTSISITRSVLTRQVLNDILLFINGGKDVSQEYDDIKYDDNDNNISLNNIIFQSNVSNKGSLSFKNGIKLFGPRFKRLKWSITADKSKGFVIQHIKKSQHDRTASTNVLKSQKTLDNTEQFVIASSFGQFEDFDV